MPTPFGIAVTAWTARCAVGCYLLRLWIDIAHSRSALWQKRGRLVWTIGLFVFILHVGAALHYYHSWSQSAAWEHTRVETLRQTGWNSGAGLLVNYAFLAIWFLDVAAWWIDVRWPQRRKVYLTLQAIYAFLIIQATVFFGPSGWIPVAICSTILFLLAYRRRHFSGHIPPAGV